MKVAHIVSTFYPHVGGMGEVCFLETDNLRDRGELDITVFTLHYPKTEYRDELFPFTVKRLRAAIKIGDAGWMCCLKNKLQDFDIVHFHFPFYGAEKSVIEAKKEYGFKLIITYHMDAQVKGFKKIIQNVLDFLYGKKLFEIADKIIYIDEERFKHFKFFNEIIKLKSFYLPNAVETEIFKPQEKNYSQVGLDKYKGKKIILFVGNLLPVKNLEILIKAMPEIQKESILLVIGGGYAEKRYKKMVKEMNLNDRVIFYGIEKNKEILAQIYNLASALAVPSHYETFSLSALEALSCGIPVIGNNIPGVRGRIAHGIDGILLTENTKEQWADAINSVLQYSEEQRKNIAKRARQKAVVNYSVETHINKLIGFYKD